MFSGCCFASVTNLLTLCWAPNCQRKAKVTEACSGSARAYTFCTVPTAAVLVCRRKDNQMWLKNLCIIASPGVKEFVPVFSPWLHMERIISWHLTLTCVINSVSKLSASFTSCALDYNLGSLKVKCSSQEFLLFLEGGACSSIYLSIYGSGMFCIQQHDLHKMTYFMPEA